MANAAASIKDNEDSSDFAALLNQSLGNKTKFTGQVVNGRVVRIDGDMVIVDVGLKSEGRIALREFNKPGQESELRANDTVEVYVERMEDREGYTQLSREKARREEVWVDLDKACEKKERVTGVIFARVKGGFTVDLGGAVAFLPGSQVDIRPVRDVSPLMGTPQPFMILKMDRVFVGTSLFHVVPCLKKARAEATNGDLISQSLKEGQILEWRCQKHHRLRCLY